MLSHQAHGQEYRQQVLDPPLLQLLARSDVIVVGVPQALLRNVPGAARQGIVTMLAKGQHGRPTRRIADEVATGA